MFSPAYPPAAAHPEPTSPLSPTGPDPRPRSARPTLRTVAASLALSIPLSTLGGLPASAESPRTATHLTAAPVGAVPARVDSSPAPDALADLATRLDRLPATATHAEVAAALFPNDERGRAEYRRLAGQFDRQMRRLPAVHLQPLTIDQTMQAAAVPAAVAALIPITLRCTLGALGNVGWAEIVGLMRRGQRSTAEARIDNAIGGCLAGIVPWGWLRNKIKRPVAAVVVAIIIRLTTR